MKWKTLSAFIALTCVACSGEDIQLDLEKVQSNISESTKKRPDSDKDVKIREKAAAKSVSSQRETSVASLTSRTSALELSADSSQSNAKHSSESNDVSIGLEKAIPIDPEMMRELEESLAKINDAELMAAYGKEGSAIDLKLGGSDLSNGTVALVVSQRSLVSNVTSVSGATSITGDPTGFGFTIGLSGDYLFEFDKDTLTPKAQAALESVLTLYKDYQGTKIQVAGHTDAKGSNDYNLDLSKRRASSVKQWFKASGIDSSLITTQGYGETKPVAKNTKNGKDYPEGRALNRRVEIIVKTKKKVNHLPTVSKPSSLS